MVKKLLSLVTSVLALNFLLAAGGVGFLVFTGKLDKAKVQQIRELLVAKEDSAAPTSQPTTQPAQESRPDSPIVRLDELLASTAGRSASEQAAMAQTAFDAQAAMLERRARELDDRFHQLQQAQADFESQRKTMLEQDKALQTRVDEQSKLENDKGFQDTLALYQSLPAKRTKAIFMTLPDDTVVRYLQAMDSRQASGVLKEFKTPEETSRAQALLEKMRQASAKAN